MRVPALVLEAGGERYALDASQVTEVVPAVPLRGVAGTVPGVVGVFRFRGGIVPVVDLSVVFTGAQSANRWSTRIAVCDLRAKDGAAAGTGVPGRLGVLAERVTRVTSVDPEGAGSSAGPKTPTVRGLGRLVEEGGALLQMVRVEDLVPPDVLSSLSRETEEEAQ